MENINEGQTNPHSPDPPANRLLHLTFDGTEWVDDRCGCRYHPDDDNSTHGGGPHVHQCDEHHNRRVAMENDE